MSTEVELDAIPADCGGGVVGMAEILGSGTDGKTCRLAHQSSRHASRRQCATLRRDVQVLRKQSSMSLANSRPL